MCFHWRELHARKRKRKKRIRRNVEAELYPEGVLTWAKAED